MIPFTKAHACGNDFLIVESRNMDQLQQGQTAQRLCARNTGVGADGIEYFEWTGEHSGRIKLYNADGSIAEISGNGTRCVAAWMAHSKGLREGQRLVIETDAGPRECLIITAKAPRFQIASRMGVPSVESHTLRLESGELIEGAVVSTGNPHFVIFVDSGVDSDGKSGFLVHGRRWQEVGDEVCHHADFPRQTNVEFVRIVNSDEIEIRIFERGVGPTLSSGTGTCAASVASIAGPGVHHKLSVHAPGGTQQVEWDGKSEMLLTGPAELIASGASW